MVVIAILIKRLVKILKSESRPGQIALGFVTGMTLGFISLKTLIALPLVIFVILVRVNIASVLFSYLLFRLISYFIYPVLNRIGYFFLVELDSLRPLWTKLYSIDLVPYTRFNNTLIFGSLVISVLLAIPLYIAVKKLVIGYREKYEEKIKKWKIVKIFSGSRLIKWVSGLKNIGA